MRELGMEEEIFQGEDQRFVEGIARSRERDAEQRRVGVMEIEKSVVVGWVVRSMEGERNGGAAIWRRRQQRRPEVAATAAAAGRLHDDTQRTRQGEAAVSAAGMAAARGGAASVAAAEAAVGLLPCSSLSSYLRGEIAPFFLQMTARICGGVPSPLIEPIMGQEGKGPT